jgi:atlastin
MGGEEFCAKYRDQLEEELKHTFENYKSHNESKNIFRAANTPITLGAIAMIFYILSQLFSIFGLYPIANILNLLMLGAILLLSTWGYIRYSGNLSELGEGIDTIASTVWDAGLSPLFELTVEKGTNIAANHVMRRQMSTVTPPSAMSVKKHS